MFKGIGKRYLRFIPTIICVVALFAAGFGLLTPQNKSLACSGRPCISGGTCGGLGACCCTLGDNGSTCQGSCVSGCAEGGANYNCADSGNDCRPYFGTCSTKYHYSCGYGGETVCECVRGASFGSCSKNNCD